MDHAAASSLPPPSPEHRRVAAGQFEHANQVVAAKKNYDYGIKLLLSCCRLDPANLIYRQALRRTQRAKYNNNLRGGWLAWLTTWPTKARLKAALRAGDYLKALEHGERVLARNPWDTTAQLDMSAAADALGLLDLAVWNLEQARHKEPLDPAVNRRLAELCEKRGNFTQAMALWTLVRKKKPGDAEAEQKLKDLAVHDTIARGSWNESPAAAETTETAEARALGATTPAKPVAAKKGSKELPALTASPLERDASVLREKAEADPTNPNPWMSLAALYRRADALDKARAVLREGLGPTGNSFHLALELTDLEIEPFRRDLAHAEERLRADAKNEELRKIRSRLRKEINTRELELHRMKADRFPTALVHRYEVGVRLLRAGQVDEAIQELQAARSDLRLYWQAVLHLGHCFKARNNWRLAQRNYEDALKNLPANEKGRRKEILFLLAEGCAEHGELEKAIDLGSELANEDFGYRDIGRLLDEWQARVRQTKAVT